MFLVLPYGKKKKKLNVVIEITLRLLVIIQGWLALYTRSNRNTPSHRYVRNLKTFCLQRALGICIALGGVSYVLHLVMN